MREIIQAKLAEITSVETSAEIPDDLILVRKIRARFK